MRHGAPAPGLVGTAVGQTGRRVGDVGQGRGARARRDTEPGPTSRPHRDPPAAAVVHRGPGPLDRPGLRWLRLDALGLALAVAFGSLAMTPSLIPRTWLVQGLASGLSAAVGYGLGTLVWFGIRRTHGGLRLFARARTWVPRRVRAVAWPLLLAVAALVVLVALSAGVGWQRELALLVGMEPPTSLGYARAVPTGAVVAAVPIAFVRLVRHADHVLVRGLRRYAHLPRRIAAAVAVVVLAVVIAAITNSAWCSAGRSRWSTRRSAASTRTYPGFVPPACAIRSGSPASLVPWDTLGKEGRHFVTAGRAPPQLAAAAGRPARRTDPRLRRPRVGPRAAGPRRPRRRRARPRGRVLPAP